MTDIEVLSGPAETGPMRDWLLLGQVIREAVISQLIVVLAYAISRPSFVRLHRADALFCARDVSGGSFAGVIHP